MRILLDTNILISGFAFSGPERRLLQILSAGGHIVLTNNYLLSEVQDVLARKFPDKKAVYEKMFQMLSVEIVPDSTLEEVEEARKHLRDRKDGPILALALKCRPDIFVSGDKDLHTPEVRSSVAVLTTSEALRVLEGQTLNPEDFTLHEEISLFAAG